jgi:4a-hydroxytetrahydrobiopterin dehydratase
LELTKNNSEWKEIDDQLCKSFVFKDFVEAFYFMTKVATIAEQENHHPWWSNEYNKVEIKLSTHDAGNIITEKDRLLASLIDNLISDK